MKIFAYGSNLDLDRLRKRTPSAVKVSNASIKGYQFKCNKISNTGSSKGNIVFTNRPEDEVWGVIFEIDDNEKKALDDAEGLGQGYNETKLTVTDTLNQSQLVQVYVADPTAVNDNLLPFDWYKEFIVSGAVSNELPNVYTDNLKVMDSVIDTDEKRRKKNFSIINGSE